MESAYTLANRELAKQREDNRTEHMRRAAAVRAADPDYSRIEARLAQGGAALVHCVLNKGENYEAAKEQLRSLQKQKAALLKKLRLPQDYLDEIYTCPDCRDTGFDTNGRRCHCLLQLIAKYMGINANLTEYMKEQTFDRVDYSLFADQPAENGRQPLICIKRAYERGLRFAETFDSTHSNLLLMGNSGTGKTYLSSCIANYALAREKSVYYQTAFRLFDTLEKLKFDRLDPEETEQAAFMARHLYQVELLIIDDLGTEFVTAYSSSVLFDLINTRLLQKKSSILSTNLNSAALEKLYSRRFTSRLWGSFEKLRFIGRDLRMPKDPD